MRFKFITFRIQDFDLNLWGLRFGVKRSGFGISIRVVLLTIYRYLQHKLVVAADCCGTWVMNDEANALLGLACSGAWLFALSQPSS